MGGGGIIMNLHVLEDRYLSLNCHMSSRSSLTRCNLDPAYFTCISAASLASMAGDVEKDKGLAPTNQ